MRALRRFAITVTGLLAVGGLLVPVQPAIAQISIGATCTYSGSVHLSNGINTTLANPSGLWTLSATMLCVGSPAGLATLTGSGSYTDAVPLPVFAGSWNASGFLLGGNCSGNLSGMRAGNSAFGTLSSVNCFTVANSSGAFGGTWSPNPTTINTCGGSTTDPTYCDLFVQGSMTFSGLI